MLMDCSICKHSARNRWIGPDLNAKGLFNLNNEDLFSHSLLNRFTSEMTLSETPFSAFCLSIRDAYTLNYSQQSLCSTDTFRKAWYCFTELQELDSGMKCHHCGSEPREVIGDGVSAGYPEKFKRGNLNPPTTVSANDPINTCARRTDSWFFSAEGLDLGGDTTSLVTKFRRELFDWAATEGRQRLQKFGDCVFRVADHPRCKPGVRDFIRMLANGEVVGNQRSSLRHLIRQVSYQNYLNTSFWCEHN